MNRRTWSLLVLVVAAATAALLALAPVTGTTSCTAGGCTSSARSLVATEGTGALALLTIPVVLAAMSVASASRRAALASAIGLTLLAILTGFSIGLFLLPVAALAWFAAAQHRPPGWSSSVHPST